MGWPTMTGGRMGATHGSERVGANRDQSHSPNMALVIAVDHPDLEEGVLIPSSFALDEDGDLVGDWDHVAAEVNQRIQQIRDHLESETDVGGRSVS